MRAYHLKRALDPEIPFPDRRVLRVFAFDPSLGTVSETAAINETTIDIDWEDDLKPGPVGEYIEVVDVDPASRAAYAPVDLNHPALLATDGLAPSEGNPQFHQQMAYAVAMRTIEFFERALGRRAMWAPRFSKGADGSTRSEFVQRLRIYPHAIREANSYYSREHKAVLLGYFQAPAGEAGSGLPNGVTFCTLSHDIIAHEVTHGLLDGLHRRFAEATNPDVLAFHEAFADIVALFQHFTLADALRSQMRHLRGDLQNDGILSQIAIEFGQSYTGSYSPLRNALGTVKDGKWQPPARKDYDPKLDPHDLGSVLVSAVFAAFLTIYRNRRDELVGLATGGTGVLPEGDIPTALADALAEEASRIAAQVLRMCIRALDYCPPIDITFGDYLRALITADRDLAPSDPRNYRVAFVAAFRDRGIYPAGVRHISPGNLIWEPPPLPFDNLIEILPKLDLTWDLRGDRRAAYGRSQENGKKFHAWLVSQATDDVLESLGVVRQQGPGSLGDTLKGVYRGIEVHSVRPARRITLSGQASTDLVIEITQAFYPDTVSSKPFRAGCTMLIDLETSSVRYLVRKRLADDKRLAQQIAFRLDTSASSGNPYFEEPPGSSEPFAMLHRHAH